MSLADTNVLVAGTLAHAPGHNPARSALDALAGGSVVSVSRPIMREYGGVLTRPQAWGAPISVLEAMRRAATATRGFAILDDAPRVWNGLRQLFTTATFGGKRVHDANIVATMLAYGVRRLLIFTIKDFRRFEPLIEVIEP